MLIFKLMARGDKRAIYIKAWSIKHACDYAVKHIPKVVSICEIEHAPAKHEIHDTTARAAHVDKRAEAERQKKFRADKKQYMLHKDMLAEHLAGTCQLSPQALAELEASVLAYEARQRGPRGRG